MAISKSYKINPESNSKINLVDDNETENAGRCALQARYILTVLLFFACAFIYALRVNINITIVAMVKHHNATSMPGTQGNDSDEDTCVAEFQEASTNTTLNETTEVPLGRRGTLEWSLDEQATILGGFYYGYMSTQLIGGRLAHRFGPRFVFGGGILLSSILTLLTPLAAETHIAALVTLRVLIGLCQGISFPAIYSFLPYWYTTKELSTHLGVIMTGNHFGTIVAMPIAGYLCDHGFLGGWPSVYYLFGSVGCVFCILLFVFVADKPDDHSWITLKELTLIREGRGSKNNEKNPPVPWKQILLSLPVLSLGMAKMTAAFAYHVVLTRIPAYLDGVLNFSVESNGLINSILYICKSVSGILAGFLADLVLKKNILSTDPTRKVFEAIALIGVGVFTALIPLMGCDVTAVVVMLALAQFVSGFNCGGDYPAPTDMAPTYSGTIFGIINTFAAATGVLAPLAVGLILQNKASSLTQWSYVFYVSGGVCIAGIVIFVLFGSAKLQPWGNPPEKK